MGDYAQRRPDVFLCRGQRKVVGQMYLESPCPPHYQLPFDSLIVASWVVVAILCLDLTVMLVAQVIWRFQPSAAAYRTRGRYALAVSLALILGMTVALGLTFSLQRQNLALCLVPGDIHYTPQFAAETRSSYAQLVRHASVLANETLAASLGLGVLGTLATLLTLRRPRRAQPTAQRSRSL